MAKIKKEAYGIGKMVREARIELGRREGKKVSQIELAKRARLAPTTVNQIESGERPNPTYDVITSLERVLGISLARVASKSAVTSSFDDFVRTPLGQSLNLTASEIAELRQIIWYGTKKKPSPADWFAFIRLWRAMDPQ